MFETVAVVGATGAVGTIILELLEKRNFPAKNYRLLASARIERIGYHDVPRAARGPRRDPMLIRAGSNPRRRIQRGSEPLLTHPLG